jgi:hypothetical protein
MFGYEYNKATEVGYLLVLNTVLKTKAELDSFLNKTLVQLQADTRVLATASPGNTLTLSTAAEANAGATTKRPRYNRQYKGYLSAASATLTYLRNGEIKGVVLIVGTPCKRSAFMEFGDGKEITSTHKYIATESPVSSMVFTFPTQDTL